MPKRATLSDAATTPTSIAARPPSNPLIQSDDGEPARTPDGRYIIVRGRLWRATNPNLPEDERKRWVNALMDARRAVKAAKASDNEAALKSARAQVHEAKLALGERGPVWWDDDAPDENRKLVKNSSYAAWWNASAG